MKTLSGKRIVLILAVVGLVAAGLFWFARGRQSAASEYFTSPVTEGPLRNVVSATGVVQTVVTVQVGSQVSGQLQELYADFNTVVKRGQLLAKLDPRNFETQVQNSRANVAAVQARVRSAEADLKTQAANVLNSKASLEVARVARDNAATQLRRAMELREQGLVPQSEYDNSQANADSARARYEQAEAAVEQVQAQGNASIAQLEQVKAQLQQAQADLDRALLNLEYCNIYSPVDGVVISRNVDVGQTIASGLQVATLFSIANDLSQMQVNASIDEADIGNISTAGEVKFTVDAYPYDVFLAEISEIRLSPQTVQNVVTYSVILSIDNSERKLRPGMTANITITVDQREHVVKVPNAGLRYTPAGQTRPEPQTTVQATRTGEEDAPVTAEPEAIVDRTASLAPGQKWNPADKIQFSASRRRVERSGLVWVLNAQRLPEVRTIVVGITDGSATEVISGDLKPGDAVIIGDSAQAPATNTPAQRGGFGFGPGGGGGRGF